MPHRLALHRIAHQRGKSIDAMQELAVGHRHEQRKHHAEMQRQQRAHRRGLAQDQQRHAGQAGEKQLSLIHI